LLRLIIANQTLLADSKRYQLPSLMVGTPSCSSHAAHLAGNQTHSLVGLL